MSENMLNVENLVIHYETDEEVVEAVNNLSLIHISSIVVFRFASAI